MVVFRYLRSSVTCCLLNLIQIPLFNNSPANRFCVYTIWSVERRTLNLFVVQVIPIQNNPSYTNTQRINFFLKNWKVLKEMLFNVGISFKRNFKIFVFKHRFLYCFYLIVHNKQYHIWPWLKIGNRQLVVGCFQFLGITLHLNIVIKAKIDKSKLTSFR